MKLIFLDIETTGLNPNRHEPFDIAIQVLDSKNLCQLDCIHLNIKLPYWSYLGADPKALEYNGFSIKANQEKGEELYSVREKLYALFSRNDIRKGSSIFVCQNPSFDREFFGKLIWPEYQIRSDFPYHWLDLASIAIGKGIFNLEKNEVNVSKDRIAEMLGLPPEDKPHKADKGVEHMIMIYKELMK